MLCQILDTGTATAAKNMEIDQKLLKDLGSKRQCILHLYDWEGDSATYGYFVDPFQSLDLNKVQKHSIQLARRSTGGGIIFHLWDFAFSLLVPSSHPCFTINTLENYQTVNHLVADAVRMFSGDTVQPELLQKEAEPLDESCVCFCMAKPTHYDVMVNGQKVAGGAQRRTRLGFLHQGTISLIKPDRNYLEDLLLPHTKVLEAFDLNTFALVNDAPKFKEAKQDLQKELVSVFREGLAS
jgi:lipoate-protein ligase A